MERETLNFKTFASVAMATVLGLAPVAANAAIPASGSTCTTSGQVIATSKTTSVCLADSKGKLVWSKPLPVSKVNLVMADAWVKSLDVASAGMMPMTAAFGTIINPTSHNVRIIAAYTSAAPSLQLHEVVMQNGVMTMQQKSGGFVVLAKGSHQLKPGADHTMFMSVAKNINPGDIVYVTYVTSTGGRFTQPFLAKVFVGGNETYNSTPATK